MLSSGTGAVFAFAGIRCRLPLCLHCLPVNLSPRYPFFLSPRLCGAAGWWGAQAPHLLRSPGARHVPELCTSRSVTPSPDPTLRRDTTRCMVLCILGLMLPNALVAACHDSGNLSGCPFVHWRFAPFIAGEIFGCELRAKRVTGSRAGMPIVFSMLLLTRTYRHRWASLIQKLVPLIVGPLLYGLVPLSAGPLT